MPKVTILHNPEAGDADSSKGQILDIFKSAGFECDYYSTKKKGWDDIDEDTDVVIIAGGDGTVRKVVKKLMKRKLKEKRFPILVFPVGTANNIAQTFYPAIDSDAIIQNLLTGHAKKLDIGRVCGLPEDEFFIESLGMGVFPQLMKNVKKDGRRDDMKPEDEIKAALKHLYDLVLSYEPKYCELKLDEKDHSGRYMLIEVMNIRSVGPNLFLAPDADPGDGLFDVVMIAADDQHKFAEYILRKIENSEEVYNFDIVRAKNISLTWEGTHLHIDDELIKTEKNALIEIELQEGLLQYY